MMIIKYTTILLTSLMMSSLSHAKMTDSAIGYPIPGYLCQAYDEAALSGDELIRTTSGIRNNSNVDINIYCPVKTKINSTYHYFTLATHSTSTDSDYECFLAYNAYSLRRYSKLQHKGNGNFVTSVKTERFGWHPVTIKCTLRPGQQIANIMTNIDILVQVFDNDGIFWSTD